MEVNMLQTHLLHRANCPIARVLSKYVSSTAARLKAREHNRLRVYRPSKDTRALPQRRPYQAVCLLVGWANSSNKVISKYASIYTELGVPCIALAPKMPEVWFTSSGNKLCEAALNSLEEEVLEAGSPLSLIIHTFSGGLYVVFPKILENWARSDSILRTGAIPKCMVFDSGPSDYTIQSGTAAAKLLLRQGAFNILTYFIANAIGISTTFLIGRQKKSLLRTALKSDVLAIPQLYLHSKRDTVATFEWVCAMIREQEELDRKVSSRAWDDSQHLRLYLDHKEEYTSVVHTFLSKCEVVSK